jgi:biofilm protein TabA
MIVDKLKNYHLYTGLHVDLGKGFKAIEQILLEPIPQTNQDIHVNGMKVVVQHYRSKASTEKKMEGHRKCIDIQYIVKGKETIYWENTDGLIPSTAYNEERDHLNYGDGPNSTPIRLHNGLFAIFFPDDSHKTGCIWDEEHDITKLIVKVLI